MNITIMEKQILWASYNNEYDVGGSWVFAIIDNSRIDPKKARGVISSLLKKKLVVTDWDEDSASRNKNNMLFGRTDAGDDLCEELGIKENSEYPE